jgi:hypothetical protein
MSGHTSNAASEGSSPKWVFVVRALVTVKGTGAAKDEPNKM